MTLKILMVFGQLLIEYLHGVHSSYSQGYKDGWQAAMKAAPSNKPDGEATPNSNEVTK